MSDPTPPPTAAPPTLDYGRLAEPSDLARLVRGLAVLLILFGGLGVYLDGTAAWARFHRRAGAVLPSSDSIQNAMYRIDAYRSLIECVGNGLLCVGGVGVLLRRPAAAWVVVGGALTLLAAVVFVPAGVFVVLTRYAEALTWLNVRQGTRSLLYVAPSALPPLVLLWLFARRLIRGAIGVK